ncbi:MAG: AAA family ATPase, partial [Gammaproteobacteria bacterium]|nr:AAA family ATPase [Gammaproteobacteria bacterium]
MRLQAIKLAGFKSFVDPTTVPFPTNLCAVVGPNGCGKSNIIDAVRWVMGESSAKTLRGESMTDVIFNGSNTRKPVGQASIELMFDNTEGRLSGEFAAYSEISVKRVVTRDAQSGYFLNNQKCRRKDITDLFLGTGLGPRSYSIIEQGMISDLIEAKPEDLRSYLEEAAGISKYKERRKETERRIRHTNDNLDRLTDLRDELERQLTHLERQAKSAERYTELKKEERELKAGLAGLRWNGLTADVRKQDHEIDRLTIEQEARIADQRRIDAEIEAKRAALTELSDELNEVQKRYYDHGTEIARIEDSIQFQSERTRQLGSDLDQVLENLGKVGADLNADELQLTNLREDLASTSPQQSEIQSLE